MKLLSKKINKLGLLIFYIDIIPEVTLIFCISKVYLALTCSTDYWINN